MYFYHDYSHIYYSVPSTIYSIRNIQSNLNLCNKYLTRFIKINQISRQHNHNRQKFVFIQFNFLLILVYRVLISFLAQNTCPSYVFQFQFYQRNVRLDQLIPDIRHFCIFNLIVPYRSTSISLYNIQVSVAQYDVSKHLLWL